MIADDDADLSLETEEVVAEPEDSQELEADGTDADIEDDADENAQESAPDVNSELPGTDPAESEDDHKGRVRKRIEELARQKNEQRERGDRLEQEKRELLDRLERLESLVPKAPEPSEPVLPSIADFDSDEAYQAAMQRYTREVVNYELEQREKKSQEAAKQQEAEKRQREQAEKAKARIEWLQAANTESPGIVARAQALPALTETSADVLVGMDPADGIRVIEYLEANPKDALEIAGLSPEAQERILMEIGTGKPATGGSVKTVTKAPRPTKPTGATRKAPSRDPTKMSLTEYEAWRRQGGGK